MAKKKAGEKDKGKKGKGRPERPVSTTLDPALSPVERQGFSRSVMAVIVLAFLCAAAGVAFFVMSGSSAPSLPPSGSEAPEAQAPAARPRGKPASSSSTPADPREEGARALAKLEAALVPTATTNLDLAKALTIVRRTVFPSDTLAALSFGGVPLLHYVYNLLPRIQAQQPALAPAVMDLVHALLDAGADPAVRHPGGEPSLLFKSIVSRELNVTRRLLASRVGPQPGDQLWLLRLVSVPCDPVPFSKLLLHADTALRSPKVVYSLPKPPFHP